MTEKTAVTAGPWRWWTSCSWRRLSSDANGKDGGVACPYVSRGDGHPDINISDADMAFIESACNACFAINPNHPEKVAAEIMEAFNLLRTSAASCRTPEWKARRDCLLSRLGATNGS